MTTEQIKLVEDNIKLVNYFIYQFYPNLIGDEDIYQEACIGLVKAAKSYDESRGSFSKYVGLMIRNVIGHYFQNANRKKRKNVIDDLMLDDEKHEGITFKELLSEESFEKEVIQKQLVESLLNQLTDREREFVKLYYFDGITYQQMSDIKGVTRERCRQIVTKSIKKLNDFM